MKIVELRVQSTHPELEYAADAMAVLPEMVV